MKKLVLIRHAKSSWEHQVPDFERPLKKRGINDAQLISKYVKGKIEIPDLILSSDANRAKSTAIIFKESMELDDRVINLRHDLNDFSGENLLKTIKGCSDSINTLMIF